MTTSSHSKHSTRSAKVKKPKVLHRKKAGKARVDKNKLRAGKAKVVRP